MSAEYSSHQLFSLITIIQRQSGSNLDVYSILLLAKFGIFKIFPPLRNIGLEGRGELSSMRLTL